MSQRTQNRITVILKEFLTLIPGAGLAVHAVGQVRAIAEHPGLGGWGLAGCRGPEGPVPAGPSASELSREVHGEGAQPTVRVFVRVGRAPAGLLLDEGVRGQRAVGCAGVKVQHRSPLRGAAHGQGTVTVPPWQSGHGREKSVEVTYIGTHFRVLETPERPS